jgi:hypothetical protein
LNIQEHKVFAVCALSLTNEWNLSLGNDDCEMRRYFLFKNIWLMSLRVWCLRCIYVALTLLFIK